ncbi:acyl carrier protein [Bacillus cereus]
MVKNEEIKIEVVETIEKLLNLKEINHDSDLKNLGLDSMNTVNLILTLEENFKIVLSDEDLSLSNFKNINEVIKLIIRKLN